MTEDDFFYKLSYYVKKNNIQGFRKHHSYTYNNYASFRYQNTDDFLVLVGRENPIGNIDVYSVQFKARKDEQFKKAQNDCLKKLVDFFEWCYKNQSESYILNKHNKSNFSGNPRDYLASILKKNHQNIKRQDFAALFFDLTNTQWAFYSKPEKSTAYLEDIQRFYEMIHKLRLENTIQNVIGVSKSHRATSQRTLTTRFYFKEEKYKLTVSNTSPITFCLNYEIQTEEYVPILFKVDDLDLIKHLHELEETNRLIRLIVKT